MHETLCNKIENQIEEGNSHQVKWGELLQEFSKQTEGRIVTALCSLSPNQLASISDGIRQAHEESKKKSLEVIKNKMLELGLEAGEVTRYLRGSESTSTSSSNRKQTPKVAREKAEQLYNENFDIESKEVIRIVKETTGFDIPATAVYTVRAKVKKQKNIE